MTRASAPYLGVARALMVTCLAGICASGFAATLTLGSASAVPGFGICNLPVSLTVEPGEQVAGAQWDVVFNSDMLTVSSIATGPAAAAAGKSVSFSTLSPGTIRVLVTGLNMNVMSSGVMATVSALVPMGSPPGDQPVEMDNAVLSDPYGMPVPCAASSGVLTIEDVALSTGLDTWLRLCLGCGAVLIPAILYLTRQGKARWISGH